MNSLNFDLISEKTGIPLDWIEAGVAEIFYSKEWKKLQKVIISGRKKNIVVPSPENVFRALKECPLSTVRVVIIGQDPYHTPDIADGLAFSSGREDYLPPSLRNIFKEMESDTGYEVLFPPYSLDHLPPQGVLLLNTALTTEIGNPGAHLKYWSPITIQILGMVNIKRDNVVWIAWGNHAHNMIKFAGVDPTRHWLIHSPHPSPFSASRGFFGSRPFSKCNDYLTEAGEEEIEWWNHKKL